MTDASPNDKPQDGFNRKEIFYLALLLFFIIVVIAIIAINRVFFKDSSTPTPNVSFPNAASLPNAASAKAKPTEAIGDKITRWIKSAATAITSVLQSAHFGLFAFVCVYLAILGFIIFYFLKSPSLTPSIDENSGLFKAGLIFAFIILSLTLQNITSAAKSAPPKSRLNSAVYSGIKDTGKTFFYIFLPILAIGILAVIYSVVMTKDDNNSTMRMALIALMAMGGLYSVYVLISKTYFVNNMRNSVPILGLLFNIIFLIPCTLFGFLNKFAHDTQNISAQLKPIIIAEIVLIFAFFAIPAIMNWTLNHEAVVLLEDPIYLDAEKTVGDKKDLYGAMSGGQPTVYVPPTDEQILRDNMVTTNGDKRELDLNNPAERAQFEKLRKTYVPSDIGNAVPRYNYSITAWFNLFSMPPNMMPNKYYNILRKGNDCPKVSYNPVEVNLRIEVPKTGQETNVVYESSSIDFQKWNYLVLNYNSGTLDVFINNKLVVSKTTLIPRMELDSITLGENGGLSGGIRDVKYFYEPISMTAMSNEYIINRG